MFKYITWFILFWVMELWALAELLNKLNIPFFGQCILFIANIALSIYIWIRTKK